jgi:type II secretory ATPase GspE/PulE/Tfp pilus assembly ATPase PilB-like protein
MATLRDDAWAKARAGLTTVEEILRVTQEDT